MIFDELNYEKVLEAVTPVAEAMTAINSNSMKIALSGDDNIPIITVVVSRDDKAALVSAMMDVLDKAYDRGRDGESCWDELSDEMSGVLLAAYEAGATAEANRPEPSDEDLEEDLDFVDDLDEDWDEDPWDDEDDDY